MSTNVIRLYCDGASRGNPGPAAIGAVLYPEDSDEPLREISEAIGTATNNVAEYTSLIRGLEASGELAGSQASATTVYICMDSELVVRQMQGRYKVKNAGLRPLYERAKALCTAFADCRFDHVPRAKNARADALANAAF